MVPAILALCLFAQVDLDSLIDALDSPSWRQREAATLEIARAHTELPLETLERRLDGSTLTMEQRMRLLVAMEWRYELLPRAALGVEMTKWLPDGSKDGPQTGLRISNVVRGLPADDFLRRGDVITHMDEVRLVEQRDLLNFVTAHWPGDRVRVRGMRPQVDEWIEIDREVELGSMAVLRSQGALTRREPVADERRMLTRLRRAHLPPVRTLTRPSGPGRGSARWIVEEVARQRAQLDAHPDAAERDVALARWRTWLRAVDARLGDRFLEPERRKELQAAREALEEAIAGDGR